MYWIKNDCHNISSYYKAFEEIATAIKKATDKDEYNRLDDMDIFEKITELARYFRCGETVIARKAIDCKKCLGGVEW